jgi:hypothetical protein
MGWAEGSSRENGYNRWVTFHQIGRGSASCETALLARRWWRRGPFAASLFSRTGRYPLVTLAHTCVYFTAKGPPPI